jgi:hypothetical protein
MDEQPGLSDQYRRSSPWPVFVALGLAISEVGIVLPAYPMAVGGLLLFVGSVVGIVSEADYVATPWPLLGGLSVVLVAAGVGLYAASGGTLAVEGSTVRLVGGGSVAVRGIAVVLAGVLALAGAGVGRTLAATSGPRA